MSSLEARVDRLERRAPQAPEGAEVVTFWFPYNPRFGPPPPPVAQQLAEQEGRPVQFIVYQVDDPDAPNAAPAPEGT
jgi:hypothetical protein